MSKIESILAGALVSGAALLMASCSDNARFVGTWNGISPVDMSVRMPDVVRASSVVSVDFTLNQHKTGGPIGLSGKLDVVKSLPGDSASSGVPYQLSIPAMASVRGVWTYDIDDDDDLLVNLDMSSLKVTVDREGVRWLGNVPSAGADSLAAVTATTCERELTHAAYTDFSRFTVINDVDVDKSGSKMSFEIHSPEAEIYFVKAATE